jgi:hypothetical protein
MCNVLEITDHAITSCQHRAAGANKSMIVTGGSVEADPFRFLNLMKIKTMSCCFAPLS